MLELKLAQVADLTLPVLASSGQELQFYISTVRVPIGRSTGRSTPQSTIDLWNTTTLNQCHI